MEPLSGRGGGTPWGTLTPDREEEMELLLGRDREHLTPEKRWTRNFCWGRTGDTYAREKRRNTKWITPTSDEQEVEQL